MHQYVSTVEEEPDHLSRRAAGPLTAGSIHLTLEDMFSGWKSIAVFLDDSPKGEKIGKCAAALAHRCRAHLIGIHGMSCNPAEHPSDSFARGKEAIDRVFARLREAEEQKALAVDRLFTALAQKRGVNAHETLPFLAPRRRRRRRGCPQTRFGRPSGECGRPLTGRRGGISRSEHVALNNHWAPPTSCSPSLIATTAVSLSPAHIRGHIRGAVDGNANIRARPIPMPAHRHCAG